MSKKSLFRRPLEKQHGKCSQALLKTASQHFYQIHLSLPSQLSWKKSLLFICQILVLLVNTLAANEKYSVLNRDNLTTQIKMQLSQKNKLFLRLFLHFSNLAQILNILKKKVTLRPFVVSKLGTPKR